MKIISVIHDILRKTALTQLWIVSIFYLFIAADGTKLAAGMQVAQYFCILSFSLVITLSRYILKLSFLPYAARAAIQLATLLLFFFLIFGASGNISLKNPIPLVVIFILVYAIITFVSVLISHKFGKKTEADSKNASNRKDTYQSMF